MSAVLRYTVVRRHPDTLEAVALLEGQPVPKWAKDLVEAEDLVNAKGSAPTTNDEADDEADDEVKPYAKWLKADLEAEVAARNEDREDDALIVVGGTGKVADLAAALDADDAANDD